MKLLITSFLFLVIVPMTTFAQVNAMTYNIRYDNPNDGENWWENRKQDVAELIDRYHPDFLGTQEGIDHQVNYLNKALEGYAFVGIGRDGVGVVSEYTAIFYDSTKFKMIETKTFWLSSTPEEVSRGWDAALNRISTYGAFEEKSSGVVFHVFNAHFDHIGVTARKNAANLILEQIKNWNLLNQPLIVMGDFNSVPNSEPIKIFNEALTDTRVAVPERSAGPEGTFSGFIQNAFLEDRIDYIFVKNLTTIRQRNIDDLRPNLRWPSDHLPVFAVLKTDK